MPKIQEKIVEPSRIYAGSIFKLKIKLKSYSLSDLKKVTCAYLNDRKITVKDLEVKA